MANYPNPLKYSLPEATDRPNVRYVQSRIEISKANEFETRVCIYTQKFTKTSSGKVLMSI